MIQKNGEAPNILNNDLLLENYAALREYVGQASSVRIRAAGVEGVFFCDTNDATTFDNGGTLIVDALGRRWKRLFSGAMNVLWFGAKGNGVNDDAAAINATITASLDASRSVFFPNGVYAVASTVIIKTKITLTGQDKNLTIIKAKDGLPATPLLQTDQFDKKIGKNTPTGAYQWTVRNLTLDGNRWNVLAPVASMTALFEVYGYDYDVQDVIIHSGNLSGFYSEWSTNPNVPVAAGGDSMEARISKVKCFHHKGNGFIFRGPHDSMISKLISFINDESNIIIQDDAAYTAGGTHLTDVHSYYNGDTSTGTPSGIYIDSIVVMNNVQCETSRKGSNMLIGPRGRAIVTNIRSFLCADARQAGIIVAGNGSSFNGLHVEENEGNGIYISGNHNIVNGAIVNRNRGFGVQIVGNSNKVQAVAFENVSGSILDSGMGNTIT